MAVTTDKKTDEPVVGRTTLTKSRYGIIDVLVTVTLSVRLVTGTPSGDADQSASTSGGVHRLRNAQDDEDDTATWNGNSTQQL